MASRSKQFKDRTIRKPRKAHKKSKKDEKSKKSKREKARRPSDPRMPVSQSERKRKDSSSESEAHPEVTSEGDRSLSRMEDLKQNLQEVRMKSLAEQLDNARDEFKRLKQTRGSEDPAQNSKSAETAK
eukprot:9120692-Pyramimonas_sp.AAC.1